MSSFWIYKEIDQNKKHTIKKVNKKITLLKYLSNNPNSKYINNDFLFNEKGI